ncbi:MAG: SDR family NAD(P)-dependent oxidoreductase [Candidatus Aminicenantes bacterium]|nr:SDR family NAD(P)-dependent oxidoreductase [Candidatus Aminicenantes bacterium]
MTQIKEKDISTGLEIAVIGMAGRFPGAKNVEKFWENLKNGIESISFFSAKELTKEGIEPEVLENPNYIKARGIISDREYFDASFFDYLPKEAAVMDPQVRLFHECSWEALENAGYAPGGYTGLIGLYAGLTPNLRWIYSNLIQKEDGSEQFEALYLNSNFFSTLIAYKLNLTGPAVTVQTACSTSLVAIHQACRGLLTGECNMALAGGVTIGFPGKSGYLYQEGMIFSPDGHCRAFDARAAGTIDGEGVGIVVLKRLDAAAAAGDTIHAVIKGSAANNDGNRKVGYTAPSVEGQVEVIKAALQMAEVEPGTISYIEAHGTGTVFGDPIEVEALKRVFRIKKSHEKKHCGIGSVKTNIGHSDSAAGVAGFIKTILSLKHRCIPPNLNFESPNQNIGIENSPFYINAELKEWKSNGCPLRAGVSSFGIGGTNAHVILEEAPQREDSSQSRNYQLILLSARAEDALEKSTENFLQYLEKNREINLADVAYTLKVGRSAFEHRKILVCAHPSEAVDILSSTASGEVHSFISKEENRPVIFMFPGQGAQYVNMGLGLYKTEPIFREEMDRCFEILKPLADYDLKEILYPDLSHPHSLQPTARSSKKDDPPPSGGTDDGERESVDRDSVDHSSFGTYHSTPINRTAVTQPLIFIFEYVLAKLLLKWGIEPYAMIGHSIGKYAAACLAGVFSLDDALRLVTLRGELMQQLPPGAMLSVSLAVEEVKPLLNSNKNISLAAVNSSELCVVSGPHKAVKNFAEKLQEKGYRYKYLHTSHAFHSEMMEPILEEFEEKIEQIPFNIPKKPYISNLTGTWITIEEAVSPGYWARHIRQPIQFAAGLQELLNIGDSIFIEVGPGTVLSTFINKHVGKKPSHLVVNPVRHPKENLPDDFYLLKKLGQLWLYGQTVNWSEFYSKEKRYRIPIPTYPFEPQRYWFDKPFKVDAKPAVDESLTKKSDITNWFFVPSWERSILPDKKDEAVATLSRLNWLVFNDGQGLGARLIEKMERDEQQVVSVRSGASFVKKNEWEFEMNPQQEKEYEYLFAELRTMNKIPDRIIHLWNITGDNGGTSLLDSIDHQQYRGLYSLLNIARVIGVQGITGKINLWVVTDNMQEVTGSEELCPAKATVLGAIKVIPVEYTNISCFSIDIFLPEPGSPREDKLLTQVLAEFNSAADDNIIAYRGNHRWVQIFKANPLNKPAAVPRRLRERGVYLITGGTGGIGLTLAEYLVKTVKSRLILTRRSSFPVREDWEQWLTGHEESDPVSTKIRKLLELEAQGGEILVFSADVTDMERMQKVIAQAVERFGQINGVIHAAGIPGGAVIQNRTREITESVLAPKVKGALILDHIMKDMEPDFFVLCSSVSSVLGPPGQVGYSAANAFLDAFAYYKTLNDGIFTLSIGWDAWQEVGMAAESAKQLTGSPAISRSKVREIAHPMFDEYIGEDSTGIYISNFSTGKNWFLDDHKVMGKATLPGTAYLEMARAAFEHNSGKKNGTIEMEDIYFLSPLALETGQKKEVRTILKKQDHRFEFVIISQLSPGEDKWVEHARGNITSNEAGLARKHKIEKIAAACLEHEINDPLEGYRGEQDFLELGPRWNIHIKQIKRGRNQGLINMELPEVFEVDIKSYSFHPSLLDTAVTIRQGKGFYLPFSYKRLRARGTLPRNIFSYIRTADDAEAGEDFLDYNITIMDEQGNELVDIEKYTLKRVPAVPGKSMVGQGTTRDLLTVPGLQHFPFSAFMPANYPGMRKDAPILKDGMLPNEGIDVFTRVLESTQPWVIISTMELEPRIKKTSTLESSYSTEAFEMTTSRMSHPRPNLSTKYAAPRNEIEETIASVWQKALSIEKIGINDNFFELGSNSFVNIQVNIQLKKVLGKDIPIAAIYTHPTVNALGRYISKETTESAISIEESENMKEKSSKGKVKLKLRKERRKGGLQ